MYRTSLLVGTKLMPNIILIFNIELYHVFFTSFGIERFKEFLPRSRRHYCISLSTALMYVYVRRANLTTNVCEKNILHLTSFCANIPVTRIYVMNLLLLCYK